jgi:hypothetical protein
LFAQIPFGGDPLEGTYQRRNAREEKEMHREAEGVVLEMADGENQKLNPVPWAAVERGESLK